MKRVLGVATLVCATFAAAATRAEATNECRGLAVVPLLVGLYVLHKRHRKEAGARFLGYLQAQRERLLGQRGQMRVTRTELIERHGYDTKFAMHAVRLGYQGIEYLETGRLTLPMAEGREYCMAVRLGEVPLAEVVRVLEELETKICVLTYGAETVPESATGRRDYSKGTSTLPERSDRLKLDQLLVNIYKDAWKDLWGST